MIWWRTAWRRRAVRLRGGALAARPRSPRVWTRLVGIPGGGPRRAGRAARTNAAVLCGVLVTAAVLTGCASRGGGSATPSRAQPSGGSASSAGASGAGASASMAGSGPGSTAIASAAWIAPSAIPLDAAYRWPAPASVAEAGKSPELSAIQDCKLTLSGADRAELEAFPAAQADLAPTSGGSGGRDDWAAQETILATNDATAGDIQGVYSLYTDLVADLGKCANTASGAKVEVAVNQGPEYVATITIPTSTGSTLTWHEYLAAPYGYLVELSVYVAPYPGDQPSAAWDGAPASTVLNALESGPCSITKLC